MWKGLLVLVGVVVFLSLVVVTVTAAPAPDINGDGRVNLQDLNLLVTSFTNIFDYNLVARDYGKVTLLPTSTPSVSPTPTGSATIKVLCDGQTFDGWSNSPFNLGDSPDDTNGNILKVIRNCRFLNTADRSILEPAVKINTVDNLLVENSQFINIRTHIAGEDVGAVKFSNSTNETIRNVVIRNNFFDGIGSDGVPIGDTGPRISNITVEGNEFIGYEDRGENAMDIKSGEGPMLIRNNKMHGFRPCEGVKAGGNQDCSGSNGPAITIHVGGHNNPPATPTNITIENNEIYDNIYGISISGGNNITVRNNNFHDNIRQNVVVSGCSGCTIQP